MKKLGNWHDKGRVARAARQKERRAKIPRKEKRLVCGWCASGG